MSIPTPTPTPPTPTGILAADRFEPVAEAGLGHPGSTLAHSMAWFNDRLYLGTSAPTTRGPEDRARILSYNPDTGVWRTIWESPVLPLDARLQARAAGLSYAAGGGQRREKATTDRMGRDYGVRSMTVFQGRNDPHPCLYAGTMSIWGGVILRSEDGRRFQPVTAPGIEDDRVLSFRGLCALDGKLYTAPAGTITEDHIDRNLAPEAIVYASDDPVSGKWERVCAPAFGDPVNTGVFAMAVAHGHVYAGTGSPKRGFQLWRTDGKAAPGEMPEWTRILTDGAYRYNLNLTVAQMREYKGDLYVGSGITGFGYDVENDVGPSAAELIRVKPDGSWDLIAGDLRITPEGLKVPLAAMGEGFSNRYNSVVWSFGEHRGTLYLGMHNWEPNAWAMAGEADRMQGGYQLWATQDGESWTMVLDQGGGKHSSIGIRSICSTPAGLFIGTTNHAKLLARQAQMRSGIRLPESSEGFDVLFARD